MDELTRLHKKIAELERNEHLYKETEKRLQTANQQLQVREQQLKSDQQTHKRTQKIAHVGSWEWDVATDIVSWSDELFRIFRLNPEDGAVSYADHPKIYTPESMQRLDTAVQHTLKTAEPYEIDLEIIRGDGTNAFCTVRCLAKKDKKGNVIQLFGSFQDITERKNSEEQLKALNQQLQASEQQLMAANEQLQANEQQLRAANQQLEASEKELRSSKETAERYLNIAAKIILCLDADGNVTLLNDSGYQLLGYEVGSLSGKDWITTCLPKEQQNDLRSVFEQIMKGEIENLSNYESTILTKSGEIKTILWHNTVLKDKNGKTTGTLSSGEDITEKVKTAKELAASESFLKAIFDKSLNAILVADDAGNYITVNEASANLFGYPVNQLTKMNVHELIKTDNSDAVEKYKQYVNEGKETGEIEFTTPNGQKKIAQYNAIRIRKDFNLSVLHDVSENKKAEQELKSSELKFKNIAENVPGLVLRYQVFPDGTDKLLFISKSVENIYEIPREDVIKDVGLLWKMIHPDDLEEYKKSVEEAAKELSFWKREHRILLKDGRVKWLQAIAVPDKQEDGSIVFDTLGVDITERKQSEAELKKIEWLLQPKKRKVEVNIPDYGDLTNINQDRTILDSVGKEVLNGIVSDYLSLLDTSAAVYEKNGDYAVGIFSSEWCRFMDCSSRALCKSKDNKKALESGKWLCHESCWADASNRSIQTKKAVDIECHGGLHIYAIPIKANNEVIGAINFGYGNPPTDEDKLIEIAGKYKVSLDKLKDLAQSYETRPAFIIDIAKEKLKSSARLIGNIVERELAEQELIKAKEKAEESERKLIEAQELSHVGNWEYIIDNDTVTWSKELYAIFERSYDLPAPQYSEQQKYYTEESFAVLDKAVQDCVQRDIPYEIELDIITSSGTIKQIISKGRSLKDKNNKIIGSYGTAQDITEKKKTEQEIIKAKEKAEKSEANVTAIIEGTTNSIWAFNRSYQILYINKVMQQEFLQTFGVLLEPGLSLVEALPESLQPLWKPRYDRVLANEQFTIEDAIPTDNGPLYIQVSFNPIVKDGEVIGGSCIGSNITSRKLIELEFIAAKEKAEESDRLKSAFLANMSHEIRTPMNGILGFTNLLQDPDLTGEEQKKYVDIIRKSGDRMLNTVNDIIDISRIESGLVERSVSKVNINEQLKDLHSFFSPEAAKKGIQLIFKINASEQDLYIKTDPKKFNSIVTNLIKNAIKFTNQGFIELGYQILDENGSGKVEFYVKDSGIGIPRNRQEAIFDRFVQADIENKEAKQGSGLGLAISKAYAEMLGGKMWVDSEEGKGSTFYFTIGNDYVSELEFFTKNNNSILNENEISRKLKILVVEDDETSQYLISIVVKNFAKEIINVSSGLEAVEVCQKNADIDLILMDIQLPGLNGYEATRKIRQFNKDVVIIAQTAFALSGDKEEAMKIGCNDYISKPINQLELDEMVKKFFMN